MLSEVLDRNHLALTGTRIGSTFQSGSRRTFLDITSVSCKLLESHKRSGVLEDCSASDHRYVLQEFRERARSKSNRLIKYSTKDIVPKTFLRSFDDAKNTSLEAQLGEMTKQENYLQRIIEEPCEASLKKVFPLRRLETRTIDGTMRLRGSGERPREEEKINSEIEA